MSYNGWSNYETWCVSMWLDNDQHHYETVREDLEGNTPVEVASWLEDYVGELPEVTTVTEAGGFVCDLLGKALGNVDWQEIAESLLAEVDA